MLLGYFSVPEDGNFAVCWWELAPSRASLRLLACRVRVLPQHPDALVGALLALLLLVCCFPSPS
jgi:hypothetical protein